MCDQEVFWNVEEVKQFKKLVAENYGYKVFLDDLPSATVMPDSEQKLYTENVPLGFISRQASDSGNYDDEDLWEDSIGIFNHLDLKVLIHPSLMTTYNLAVDRPQTIKIPVMGTGGFNVEVPRNSYRIVGFEVTAKSVPYYQVCESTYDPTQV